MTDADLATLTTRVLWFAFGLGALFGAVAQRTHFCTMGAVSDIVNMGDWSRMRMWVLAIAVAAIGFHAMVMLGWVRAANTIYAGPQLRWLSMVVGGLMFGFGMVLGSGCGNKNLVRAGAGSLKSVIVLLVLGLSAWATMRGATALLRDRTVDQVVVTLPAGQDLPSLLAGSAQGAAGMAWVGVLVGLAALAWSVARREGRQADVLLGGLGIGIAVLGLWWVSGVLGHVAEHPQTLEPAFVATSSQRMESFSFVAPVAYLMEWVVFATDASRRMTVAMIATAGVVVGSFVVAVATRRFRWEGFGGVDDVASNLVGAVLMGVGGVTALGCTVGQGLSGISTLSLGSLIAVVAILIGAWAGLKWQLWRVERSA